MISLGNLAVAGARAASGFSRGKIAGTQAAIGLEDRNRRLAEDALRLSLSTRADARSERADQRADQAQTDLRGYRDEERSYRQALLRRRDQGTPRQEQDDLYASAKAIALYQASTNARSWKPETLAVYLKGRFPKLDPDRLLGIAVEALAKGGAGFHLDLDAAADRNPE